MTENGTERLLGKLVAHQENSAKQLTRIETAVEKIVVKHDALAVRVGNVEKSQAEQKGAWKTVTAVSSAFLAVGMFIMHAVHKFFYGS